MVTTLEKVKLKTASDEPCKVTLTVQVPKEAVQAKASEVEVRFQKAARLPGFRQGKAPMELVRQNFQDKIQGEVLDQIIRDLVPQIIKERSLTPVTTPLIDKIRYDGSASLTFELVVERSPDFKVRNYKGISLTRALKTVADQDVDREIAQLRERNARLVPSADESAKPEHHAVIRYEASSEGRPIADFKAENQLLNLSAPQSIEGFAEGIIGLKKGATKEITIPFPKKHPRQELAGRPVTFRVTLEDLKEKVLPAADDELAKEFELGSLAELRDRIRASLEHSAERRERAETENQIFDHLIKENPVPVPESLVTMQLESLIEQARQVLSERGVSAAPAADSKELRDKYRPQAERRVRLSYILSGLARQESLQATQDETARELARAKERDPGQAESVDRYFQEHASAILGQITDEKVIKFLIDHAKIKDNQTK